MASASLEIQIEASTLPAAVKKHLLGCSRRGKPHRWHNALQRDFERVVQATLMILDTACSNTNRDRDSLLRDADFDPNDLDPDRLDAAIAELRGINHLANEGFSPINLLRAQPGTRTADLVAVRGGERYALDVACSSASACRSVESLAEYMCAICHLKADQLSNTMASAGCLYRGIVFVVNSQSAVELGYYLEYRRAAREVHEALGSPSDYFIVVLTGKYARVVGGDVGHFEGPHDVVYPPWPSSNPAE